MALPSNNTALAIALQPVVDVFTTPTLPTALMPISALRPSITPVTIANDEYTGSPFRNADAVAGKRVEFSFNVKIRPPGGTVPPAANTFLPGLLLQAVKFTELRATVAIPVSAEALSAGTTTSATLGAGAAGTADLYKGLPILLIGQGSTYKDRVTAIRSYSAGKVATFPETYGGALSGNYQIPPYLAYARSITSDAPVLLSLQIWFGGERYDLVNCRVSAFSAVAPTSTRDNPANPEFQVTVSAVISARTEEAAPTVPAGGTIPQFKDGDCWLAGKRIGSQSFTLDLGVQVEEPPNPNKVDGVDGAELVGGTATVSMTRQKYLPSYLDTVTLADAQSQQPFFAQWGSGLGNMVQFVVPDSRLNYPSPDLGGNLVTEGGDLLIDAFDRSVVIAFPY